MPELRTVRAFPRPMGVIRLNRSRGMGVTLDQYGQAISGAAGDTVDLFTSVLPGGGTSSPSAAVTGQPWWVPDFYYNIQNQASPDQIYLANQAANAQVAPATINPITGKPVPAAVSYANATQGAAGAAEAQGMTQSTGSSLADLFNSFFASTLGTGASPAGGNPFPWGTVAIIAALGVGGYLVVRAFK